MELNGLVLGSLEAVDNEVHLAARVDEGNHRPNGVDLHFLRCVSFSLGVEELDEASSSVARLGHESLVSIEELSVDHVLIAGVDL